LAGHLAALAETVQIAGDGTISICNAPPRCEHCPLADPTHIDRNHRAEASGGLPSKVEQLRDCLYARYFTRACAEATVASARNGAPDLGPVLQEVLAKVRACLPGAAADQSVDLARQPGYACVSGQASAHPLDGLQRTRIYFSVTAEGVPALLGGIFSVLNDFSVPFGFKCLRYPADYLRLDSALLYVSARHAALTEHLLPELLAGLRQDHLRDEVPLFTRRLRAGVGCADDPPDGRSFGLHRCELLAAALLRMPAAGVAAGEPDLAAVASHFAAAGIDPARPECGPFRLARRGDT
jgi:hypothetical protein